MKKTIFILLLVGLSFQVSLAQKARPTLKKISGEAVEARKSPMASSYIRTDESYARVVYSQPHLKGREMLGGKIKYGKVWRLGANEATEIFLTKDIQIQGKTLEAGAYSLFAIPEADKWTLIFNNVAEQWGTDYDESKDALRVTVSPESGPQREMMTFLFENVTTDKGTCVLHWNQTRIPFEIQVAGN